VTDVQAPVALGVIEQLTEQVVDPLTGRCRERPVEVLVRNGPTAVILGRGVVRAPRRARRRVR
jgi:hypothetical protein